MEHQISNLLAEKDDRLLNLELQLQGYIALASHLQSRLLSALDTLDTLRIDHEHQAQLMTRTHLELQGNVDRFRSCLGVARDERDDLKDAVDKLVEKVETSSDYSLWPHSQMRMTTSLDPIAHRDGPSKSEHAPDRLLYAARMIESLRVERDAAQRACAQTQRDAEARISYLEAKVARRDAELATWAAKPPFPGIVTGPQMDHEDVLDILDLTSAKNRALEAEVSTLADRVCPSPIPHSRHLCHPQLRALREDPAESSILPLPHSRNRASKSTSRRTPAPGPNSASDSSSPPHLAASPHVRLNHEPAIPNLRSSPSPSVSHFHHETEARAVDDEDATVIDTRPLAAFGQEVVGLGFAADAFIAERKLHFDAVRDTERGVPYHPVRPCLILKYICQEKLLSPSHDRSRSTDEAFQRLGRERELHTELIADAGPDLWEGMARLKPTPNAPVHEPVAPRFLHACPCPCAQLRRTGSASTERVCAQEESDEGERSMEMATPLPSALIVLPALSTPPGPDQNQTERGGCDDGDHVPDVR